MAELNIQPLTDAECEAIDQRSLEPGAWPELTPERVAEIVKKAGGDEYAALTRLLFEAGYSIGESWTILGSPFPYDQWRLNRVVDSLAAGHQRYE